MDLEAFHTVRAAHAAVCWWEGQRTDEDTACDKNVTAQFSSSLIIMGSITLIAETKAQVIHFLNELKRNKGVFFYENSLTK